MTELDLCVIRATDPLNLVGFYSTLGLAFVEEKHGAGPTHYACERAGSVLEIYPLGRTRQPTTGVRLAVEVRSITDTLARLDALWGIEILKQPHSTASGRTALAIDPEGHTLELRERASEGLD